MANISREIGSTARALHPFAPLCWKDEALFGQLGQGLIRAIDQTPLEIPRWQRVLGKRGPMWMMSIVMRVPPDLETEHVQMQYYKFTTNGGLGGIGTTEVPVGEVVTREDPLHDLIITTHGQRLRTNQRQPEIEDFLYVQSLLHSAVDAYNAGTAVPAPDAGMLK